MNRKKRITMFLLVGCLFMGLFLQTGCQKSENGLILEVSSVEEAADFYDGMLTEEEESKIQNSDASGTENFSGQIEDAKILVHVCGAVLLPGVYELSSDSRVIDAVAAAGGMQDSADMEFVNLAQPLSDGDKVRIPTKEEVTNASGDGFERSDVSVITSTDENRTQKGTQDKININTADVQVLCTLPGIGETRAESILAYRSEHGDFKAIEDIMLVSGIKESSFQKIKDRITVK